MSMSRFAFLLSCCLLLVACSARNAGSPVAPTRQLESRTNNAALTSKMVFLGMPEEEALRRLQSSGAGKIEMETIPLSTGWYVSSSHDTLMLSFTNGVLSYIVVEENSDQPKMYRRWYSINAYSLP